MCVLWRSRFRSVRVDYFLGHMVAHTRWSFDHRHFLQSCSGIGLTSRRSSNSHVGVLFSCLILETRLRSTPILAETAILFSTSSTSSSVSSVFVSLIGLFASVLRFCSWLCCSSSSSGMTSRPVWHSSRRCIPFHRSIGSRRDMLCHRDLVI